MPQDETGGESLIVVRDLDKRHTRGPGLLQKGGCGRTEHSLAAERISKSLRHLARTAQRPQSPAGWLPGWI
jgi:hypothetical protein